MQSKINRIEINKNILNAAITEFSQHGYIGASTQAIARRAGLAKSQLHYYIGSKEALYQRVLGTLFEAWGDLFEFDTQKTSTPAEIISHYIDLKLSFALEHKELSRIFTVEVISGGKSLSTFWPDAMLRMSSNIEVINEWIEEGKIRSLDGRLLMMNIWALTQYYADYALQAEVILEGSLDDPTLQEKVRQELNDLILLGCGLTPQ
ncbi:TetR family transcriptional regulator C-terminal domain-containing protein [Psychromonas sp. 14N.309.X.WAT.B.A12]|uniref:TetR family transcriptional regulator C-terminal domain-containing protein n=1 Tax=unclassified Psychromonas TaxID=2614957 RepID=UPI0025B1AC58|nr:TetR family transcriptional regulator C-terminal domain-containing protein [Psychromonas sp. 14N.309.X.WAT.B.A12]MDN2664512.1 TetR family transcriptional regulator C-terminal domain-containing protein [Psychromonas sp. 14N.309.X.WAT.B.A12]